MPINIREVRLVGYFGLPIALRISRCGHMLLDAILLEELHQIFAHELWAVISDDGLGMPKIANNAPSYEALYVHLSRGCHGLCFYPFGEVIGYHDHRASAPNSGRHWPYQVNCSLHERPRTRLWV
ncbi:hypothetical protein ACFXTI_037691 [Malus domestica]